jgi:ppGpp synthetase/RelA/SpoT-type nucleotidyltranferase
METEKPQNIEEYKKWLEDVHHLSITRRTETYYESVATQIAESFSNSLFWKTLLNDFDAMNKEYYMETGYYLFSLEPQPNLLKKPFDSFLLKTFRKNILENSNWPNEPEHGWILPSSWYTQVNDIARTLIVVKYLDGVNFLVDKLHLLLENSGLPFTVDYEAREEGYYAAHVYTKYECEIPRENWDVEKISVKIEIQITTQLQEVIRRLLHKYYEAHRNSPKEMSKKWQWDYTSEEFGANYLGHILHYVEGMIIDIREKQKEMFDETGTNKVS